MYACFWQIPAIWKRQLHTLSSHFGASDELPLTTLTRHFYIMQNRRLLLKKQIIIAIKNPVAGTGYLWGGTGGLNCFTTSLCSDPICNPLY
jgi:hypothetical protein